MPGVQLSLHFTLSEVCRSDKAKELGIDNVPTDPAIIKNLKLVCENILEPVRIRYGGFTPNSVYRSPELNKNVRGSAKMSQHMKGQAADFEIPGVSNYDLAVWCRDNLNYDKLILEFYKPEILNSGWVHCSYVSMDKNRRIVSTTADGIFFREGLIK